MIEGFENLVPMLRDEDLEMHRPLSCAQRSKERFDSGHGLFTSETLALAGGEVILYYLFFN